MFHLFKRKNFAKCSVDSFEHTEDIENETACYYKKQYGLILNSPLNLDFIFVFNKEDFDNKYMITFQGRDLTKGCSWIYHSEKNRDNDYKKLIKNFTV